MAPLPSFSQTMCRAIQVYHLSEAICFSVQNSNGIKTRILLMFAFLTGIPTDKKIEDCHFSICGQNFGTESSRHQKSSRNSSEIQVGKAVGFANYIHTHKATHTVLFSYKKKGFRWAWNHASCDSLMMSNFHFILHSLLVKK